MSDTPQKSWQSRISEATDAIAQTFVESMSYDWRLYKVDVAGSIAHATMLAKVNLITDADRDAIVKGLKEIEQEIDRDGPKWAGFKPELEDIHMCVESALTERIGEPGRKLHTGRSRNDQVATDLLLWCQASASSLASQLSDLQLAFVQTAERNASVIMPCFTHLQRAQPIQAGAELLAWAKMFSTDQTRIGALVGGQSTNYNAYPLGSGAIAGSTLPLDRRITQDLLRGNEMPSDEELGKSVAGRQAREAKEWEEHPHLPEGLNLAMSEITKGSPLSLLEAHDFRWYLSDVNSIEATASRDYACDFVYACAMIAQHLSRFAEQWIIYMTTEFGFIKIADRYTTSSSMMPQKRNPDMLELIRGRCGNVYGDLFALMTILKGLPIGYNRDLQEDKRIVFRAYDTVSSCLTMAAAIVNSASYDKERIEPTLDRGFLDATSLAEYLVTHGVPFRTAHHVVGTLVAKCEKSGRHSLTQLSVTEFNETIAASLALTGGRQSPAAGGSESASASSRSDAFEVTDDVYTCLGAHNVVKRYQSAGAAGGKPFEQQLKAWKDRLGV